jgi:hypothetical protein
MAIEEPKYAIFLRERASEVRDYQAAIAAEVSVTGDQRTALRKGFRLVAHYIFGGNRRRQRIAMTAPVAQQRTSKMIAMTAPVTQTQSDDAWVVRFTMPSAYSLETLPEPNEPNVKLRAVAPGRFAVIRFSGLVSSANVEAKTVELIDFAKVHDLRTMGSASLAQYNPPWTPWFMRRNELLVEVHR